MEEKPSKIEQKFCLLASALSICRAIAALTRRATTTPKAQPHPVLFTIEYPSKKMPTLSSIKFEFSSLQSAWKVTQASKELKAILNHRTAPIDTWIVLGLGSLITAQQLPRKNRTDKPIRALLPSKARLAQLVVFIEIAHTLSEPQQPTVRGPTRPPVRLFAQDPKFSALDIKFLASQGITVIDNAVDLIGPSVGAFCPYLDRPVSRAVIARSPGLYLGYSLSRRVANDPARYLDRKEQLGSTGRKYREVDSLEVDIALLEESVETEFPSVAGNGWWGPLGYKKEWARTEGEIGNVVDEMCFYWPKEAAKGAEVRAVETGSEL
ncbi:hypothetical protein BU16DRAFT_536013 [Lophium mytilinum]|uniref:SRR1-like domain-containing protein n=1 Tax=Lophium mytilinum TaxID=390894 RepID=A0A6A6R4M1_9PEZI|nr:hypothetical protein BU16DRAFT_536013 [Lophium mytilinum]